MALALRGMTSIPLDARSLGPRVAPAGAAKGTVVDSPTVVDSGRKRERTGKTDQRVNLRETWERRREGDQMDKLVEMRDLITESMEAGGTLEQMEAVINSSELGEEEKSALWLFAWSYLPGQEQRSKAIAASQLLAETYDGPGPAADPAHSPAEKLSDVMGAVREHEDRTRSHAGPRRPADDWLYKRVREALTSR